MASRSKRIFYFLQHKNNKIKSREERYGHPRTQGALPEQLRNLLEIPANQENQPMTEGDEAA